MAILKCPICTEEFYRRPSEIRENNCCSIKCSGIHNTKINSEIRKCVICGKEFKVIKANIKRRMSLCCSRECLKQWWKNNKKANLCKDGYIHYNKTRIHRIIMERHLGRKLEKSEVIHHINGNKTDNRIENLQLMTQGEHLVLHKKERNTNNKKND